MKCRMPRRSVRLQMAGHNHACSPRDAAPAVSAIMTRMDQLLSSHVESKPHVCGGKPCVAGTRIRVQDIYVWHELQGRSADEIVADFPQLTLADVHAALAYYFDHKDELDRQMRQEIDWAETMKAAHTSVLRSRSKDGH